MATGEKGCDGVSDERNEAVRQVAGEVARHLAWLRDAGVREVPDPASVAPPPAGGGARGGRAPAGAIAPAARRRRAAPGRPGGRRPAPRPRRGEKGCGSPALLADPRRPRRLPPLQARTAGGPPWSSASAIRSAELMFVGEGPGADEDLQGEPFVGKAGQLLTRMIEAMGYRREQVYIANVVKCRPPGNRNPEPDEIEACEPFLRRQLEAVRPTVIVALGKFAAHTLLRSTVPITRLRGPWAEYAGREG